jgi:hypothetical protein
VIRRFLIAVLIFLIAVVVAADRLGAIVAAHVLASKVKTDERLQGQPDASIGGFPFLTQAFSGHYKDVTIKATNVPVSGVSVTSFTAHLREVHIPFSKVFHDSVSQVPVDRVDGTAFIAFGDVNSYLGDHHPPGQLLNLSPASGNDRATVLDKQRIGHKIYTLHGVGKLSLSGNVIVAEVTKLSGTSGGKPVSAKVLKQALTAMRVGVPLRSLPFRIRLTSVSISSTGISVTGDAVDVVLGSPVK